MIDLIKENTKRAIEFAKRRVKQRYGFELPVILVEGTYCSLHPEAIWIGKDNPLEFIEVLVIHEALHKVLGILQEESLIEKAKGNLNPYFNEEMMIWNKIIADFPDLRLKVGLCIMAEFSELKRQI